MSMTDPIADFLTRIRNATRARFETVDIPESKIKLGLTRVLMKEKFIRKYIRIRDGKQGLIRVFLKYTNSGQSVIEDLQRISRPGRRVYCACNEIPRVLNGLGIVVMTTPKGIISDYQAKQFGVGGEPLCKVW
ncbi:30S ribosomal protein S8 [bacterium]|nr:30S ribosomal protein S8 [bacterium]